MTLNSSDHWDAIYSARLPAALGWYEAVPAPSLQLFDRCALEKDDRILDIGAGASTLIDHLLARGFRNLAAVDVSAAALEQLKARLGPLAGQVTWVVEDVTRPERLLELGPAAVWHDRAMLHFLVEAAPRAAYRAALDRLVRPGGYVILAAFARAGAEQCSGLPVQREDADSLAAFLGAGFTRLAAFDYLYSMPSGDPRPYVYGLFQRQG